MIGKCAHLSPKAKKWSRKRNLATESFYMLMVELIVVIANMISISLKQSYAVRPLQVMDTLLKHKYLNRFFHATFLLLKIQDEVDISRDNGSISLVSMLGSQFQKQIITAENVYARYQVMRRKPVSHHSGDIFSYR